MLLSPPLKRLATAILGIFRSIIGCLTLAPPSPVIYILICWIYGIPLKLLSSGSDSSWRVQAPAPSSLRRSPCKPPTPFFGLGVGAVVGQSSSIGSSRRPFSSLSHFHVRATHAVKRRVAGLLGACVGSVRRHAGSRHGERLRRTRRDNKCCRDRTVHRCSPIRGSPDSYTAGSSPPAFAPHAPTALDSAGPHGAK